MRDEKFYEKIKDILIYKTTDGEVVTLDDYIGDKEKKDIPLLFWLGSQNEGRFRVAFRNR